MMSLTQRMVSEAARYLATRDRDLRRILEVNGPPPLWARRPGFRTLIRIILEQQVSLASADAAFRRLARGVIPFTPERFVGLGVAHLRSLGITRQKATYCTRVSKAMLDGSLDLKAVGTMDDSTAIAALTQLKGVGPWTAEIYLLMALRRPDVRPSGDIALVQSVCGVKRLRNHPSKMRLEKIAQTWRPYRSVAARMLWHDYLAERSRAKRRNQLTARS